MTNIVNNTATKNMHTHIDKAYQFLDDYLPERYTSSVTNVLSRNSITASSGVIRNVRNRISVRMDVLNALLQVAKENKKLYDSLKEKIN